mmetsp:Transcript_30448/g.59738  ORF Transcript_30448/g.59738 Transcript_30448/m.59738 type:complete len:322 (+) Transcript_30448:95-1060(+)
MVVPCPQLSCLKSRLSELQLSDQHAVRVRNTFVEIDPEGKVNSLRRVCSDSMIRPTFPVYQPSCNSNTHFLQKLCHQSEKEVPAVITVECPLDMCHASLGSVGLSGDVKEIDNVSLVSRSGVLRPESTLATAPLGTGCVASEADAVVQQEPNAVAKTATLSPPDNLASKAKRPGQRKRRKCRKQLSSAGGGPQQQGRRAQDSEPHQVTFCEARCSISQKSGTVEEELEAAAKTQLVSIHPRIRQEIVQSLNAEEWRAMSFVDKFATIKAKLHTVTTSVADFEKESAWRIAHGERSILSTDAPAEEKGDSEEEDVPGECPMA